MSKKKIYKDYFRNHKVKPFNKMGLLGLLVSSLVLSACSRWNNTVSENPCVVVEDPQDGTFDDLERGEKPIEETEKGSSCRYVKSREIIEDPVDTDEDQTPDPVVKEPTLEPVVDIIFENEKMDQELFVSHVNVGDVVVVHINKGLKQERRFSAIYEKTVESNWTIQKCSRSPEIYKGLTECYDLLQKGKCKVFYRDDLGERESPIDFKEETDNIPLKLKIGKHEYDFDHVKLYDRYSVNTSFTVNQEMLQGTNELYIKPSTGSKSKVKIGFINYSDCPNQEKMNFSIGKAALSTSMSDDVRMEFEVSLKIVRDASEEGS